MDIAFTQKADGTYTVSITDGDLTQVEGFDTAINILLLSDARATSDRVLQPESRKGWLGDLVSPISNRIFGSWIWLVNQRRLTPDTLNASVNFAQIAVNTLVTDGLAKSVSVTGEIIPRVGIQLTIVIIAPSGITTTHYVNLWELTGNAS